MTPRKGQELVKSEPAVLQAAPQQEWSAEDIDLIKRTVAKDATDAELKLFLYTATARGLNPLLNQIYCIKRGYKATMQTGIDGFRLIANRTGKLKGIERGVKRDENGDLYGWAKIYRSDWDHPAYEESALREYKGTTPTWTNMPETMIKKVAEAAALRMAFPEDLSGLYTSEEMDQMDNPGPVSQAEVRQAVQELQPQVDAHNAEVRATIAANAKPSTPPLAFQAPAIDLKSEEATKDINERKAKKLAIIQEMKKLQDENGFSKEDLVTITGIEDFHFASQDDLEEAMGSIIYFIQNRAERQAGIQPTLPLESHQEAMF